MAKVLGTTHSFVNRVWLESGLKPHLSKGLKISNDPKFEKILVDCSGLYLSPQVNAAVFSVGKDSPTQVLVPTQPTYKPLDTSILFTALNVVSSKVIGEAEPKHHQQEFFSFLDIAEKQISKKLKPHLIVDNYSVHRHKKLRKWLALNKQVTLHFIPTSSSWLDLVERFFELLTKKQLKHGALISAKELKIALREFIAQHNQPPTSFFWTKSR